MTWLDERREHLAAVKTDPDGMIRSKFQGGNPNLKKVRFRWPRRWVHIHVYSHVAGGPRDLVTLEPMSGGLQAGPCANLLRCRCGDEIAQNGYISIG